MTRLKKCEERINAALAKGGWATDWFMRDYLGRFTKKTIEEAKINCGVVVTDGIWTITNKPQRD